MINTSTCIPCSLQSSRESQVDFTEDGIFCVNELQKHIHDLQSEVSGAQEDLERVRMELRDRDQKLNDKSEEMRQLTNKVKVNSNPSHLSQCCTVHL